MDGESGCALGKRLIAGVAYVTQLLLYRGSVTGRHLNLQLRAHRGKGKGKVHPRTGYENP